MTAPLFWLPPGTLAGVAAGTELVLGGAEGRHAVTVRRVGTGESVLLADGSGLVAETVVTSRGRDELIARVARMRDASPAPPRLVLVQALAKEGRDEAAVEAATELGVDEVVPWQAARSVVVWRGARGEKSLLKWRNVARAAAKQSRRATVPQVSGALTTDQLVERVRRTGPPTVDGAAGEMTYVLHQAATTPLTAVLPARLSEALLIVGPEGGIDPTEIAALAAAGARPVRLGDTVLRSGSAGPAALAVVLAATRWRLGAGVG